jgi:1-deoxy-D-xylulose-5-phosphate synthase
VMGGYGSAVLELFNEKRISTPVIQIGWPDRFIEHATTVEELRNKYGLTVENTVAKVRAEFATSVAGRQGAIAQLR